jgi:hypothetical protein
VQEQTEVTQEEMQQALQKMLVEVKRKMKPNSKNDLIRIICALSVDNFALKVELEQLKQQLSTNEEKNA